MGLVFDLCVLGLSIATINLISVQLIEFITGYEKFSSFTKYTKIVTLRIAQMDFMCSCFTILVANWVYSQVGDTVQRSLKNIFVLNEETNRLKDDMWGDGSLATAGQTIMIINMFAHTIIYALYPVHLVKSIRKKLVAFVPHRFSQIEANKIYEKLQPDIAQWQSNLFKAVATAFFFMPILPIGMIFACCTVLQHYWTNKYQILRRYAFPIMEWSELAIFFVNMFEIVIAIFVLGQCVWDYILRESLSLASVVMIFFLAISFFTYKSQHIVSFIIKIYNKKKVGNEYVIKEANEVTYNEVRKYFVMEYDRANPITQTEAVKKWVNFIVVGKMRDILTGSKHSEELRDKSRTERCSMHFAVDRQLSTKGTLNYAIHRKESKSLSILINKAVFKAKLKFSDHESIDKDQIKNPEEKILGNVEKKITGQTASKKITKEKMLTENRDKNAYDNIDGDKLLSERMDIKTRGKKAAEKNNIATMENQDLRKKKNQSQKKSPVIAKYNNDQEIDKLENQLEHYDNVINEELSKGNLAKKIQQEWPESLNDKILENDISPVKKPKMTNNVFKNVGKKVLFKNDGDYINSIAPTPDIDEIMSPGRKLVKATDQIPIKRNARTNAERKAESKKNSTNNNLRKKDAIDDILDESITRKIGNIKDRSLDTSYGKTTGITKTLQDIRDRTMDSQDRTITKTLGNITGTLDNSKSSSPKKKVNISIDSSLKVNFGDLFKKKATKDSELASPRRRRNMQSYGEMALKPKPV